MSNHSTVGVYVFTYPYSAPVAGSRNQSKFMVPKATIPLCHSIVFVTADLKENSPRVYTDGAPVLTYPWPNYANYLVDPNNSFLSS